MAHPRYSIIIPVFNRPQEVDELLRSLTHQTFQDFEVLLIEDGSTLTSEAVYEKYAGQLNLHYYFKPNSGPGPSRNFGFEKSGGDYMVLFDSDCIIPAHYLQAVEKFLAISPLDAWGGPDRGHDSFSTLQQAMGYTMSSVLTTGGIRGGKKHLGWFQPRSFNMGMRKEVFLKTKGFYFTRFAEDIELSVRMKKMGFKTGLIPEAYVYHKRRTSLSMFFRQVSNFGKGRVRVGKEHPGEVKWSHWFPSLFLAGLLFIPLVYFINKTLSAVALSTYLVYLLAVGIDAFRNTRSISVALLSMPAAFVQLTGYGWGFLKEKSNSPKTAAG